MGEIKQTNFRLDEDEVAKFREFCKEQNWDQAQGFKHLLDVLELNRAKSAIMNRETEISEFEMHCKALLEAFIRGLELCNNAEERAKEEFSVQLEMKDKQIMDYQENISQLKINLELENNIAKNLSGESVEKDKQITELNKQIDAAYKQIETIKSSNEALTASLAIANERAKTNEEDAQNYSRVLKELEDVKKEMEKYKNNLELLKRDYEAEKKQCEMQKQLDIKTAQEIIKNEYQEKIDCLKNDYEARIMKMNEDTAKRVDDYQEKIEKANEKNELMRDKMQAEIEKYKNLYEKINNEN